MSEHQQTAEQFLEWLKGQIPLITHMGLAEPTYDGVSLTLSAALAPNVNDKGTGFGGSLATLATLCGWAMVTLYLRQQGRDCDVMIRDSQLKYLSPVTGDFRAITRLPEQAELDTFISFMDSKGRGRLNLDVEIRQGDKVAMTLSGAYVAVER